MPQRRNDIDGLSDRFKYQRSCAFLFSLASTDAKMMNVTRPVSLMDFVERLEPALFIQSRQPPCDPLPFAMTKTTATKQIEDRPPSH